MSRTTRRALANKMVRESRAAALARRQAIARGEIPAPVEPEPLHRWQTFRSWHSDPLFWREVWVLVISAVIASVIFAVLALLFVLIGGFIHSHHGRQQAWGGLLILAIVPVGGAMTALDMDEKRHSVALVFLGLLAVAMAVFAVILVK